MTNVIRIAPSLLAADFTRLGEEIRRVQDAGADLIHVDVMDGHYVPNITLGPFIVAACKRVASIPLHVHLMITDPLKYAPDFVRAGAWRIIFHRETTPDPVLLARSIRSLGVSVGVSVNPETPVDSLFDVLDHVNEVLVMTVRPGFGGQTFMPENLDKIKELRRRKPADVLDISVDGGIDFDTAARCVRAGANILVAGTFLFGSTDLRNTIIGLRDSGGRTRV